MPSFTAAPVGVQGCFHALAEDDPAPGIRATHSDDVVLDFARRKTRGAGLVVDQISAW